MNLFLDLGIAIVFLLLYLLKGIYVATWALGGLFLLQILLVFFFERRWDLLKVTVFFFWIIFGGLTLLLRDPLFLKIKASIVYYIFGLTMLIMAKARKRSLFLHYLKFAKEQINRRIEAQWGLFFLFLGSLNFVIAFMGTTKLWVYFHSLGLFILFFLFAIGQSLFFGREMTKTDQKK